MRARLTGPAAPALAGALAAAGVTGADDAASTVYVVADPVVLDDLEDALAAWIAAARETAARDGDVVTVVADALLDGDDVAGCALGHGLLAATRAYAMERERDGGVGNVVAGDPTEPGAIAATVAWLLEQRIPSGELIRAGARTHGRQRL